MGKQLRIWLFVLLGTLLTSTALLAEGVITMTTSERVGEEIGLSIKANGNVAIEGAQETGKTDKFDRKSYRLTSQTITIRGDVTELYCYFNKLTSLDVSKNAALTELNCSFNQLISLDVSKNTALTKLYCYDNQLTNLNVSGCARLTTIDCSSNYINGKAMTKLVNSLPNRRRKSSGRISLVDRSSKKRDKNRCSAADVTTVRRKNWEGAP